MTSFNARVSSAGAGGTLQVRAGSATGTVLGSATVPVTGGWETFTTVTGTITNPPTGTTTLYLTFAGSGTGALYDLDAFTFVTGTPPAGGTGPIKGLGGKCLDVRNAATADGTQIQIYTCNGSAAQTWAVTPNSTIKVVGQVPGRLGRWHRRRHEDPALDLQRDRRAELGGPGRRHAAQPVVGQVPRRLRQQLRRQHGGPPVDLHRRRQPKVDPALS